MSAETAWAEIERKLTQADPARVTPGDVSKALDVLRITLDWYAASLADDGPRVAQIAKQFTEARAAAEALMRHIRAIETSLDDLPESWKFGGALTGLTSFHGGAVEDAAIYLRQIDEASAQFITMVGPDKGGRQRSAATVLAGGPKQRLARALAPTFDYFFGPPTGTVDGDFHSFVLLAHEAATGKEATGFDEAVKAAAKTYRLTSETRQKIEARIQFLAKRSVILKGRIYAAGFLDEPRDQAHSERAKAEPATIDARQRRLLRWLESPNFPRKP